MITANDTPAAPAMTAVQADTMIALLTVIKDELQRPRLERERENERLRRHLAEQEAARRAAAAAAEAEREARRGQTLWAGGIGAGAYVRTGGG